MSGQTSEGVPALELQGVCRSFAQGYGDDIKVLDGVDLTVTRGEIVALVGPSGAGKSTLLHIAGLLEPPDAGDVIINGKPCNGLNDARRTLLRRRRLGFVYQYHHLLPEFSALENIVLPQVIAGRRRRDAAERARKLLKIVGLQDRMRHRPGKLSGGEQQRVAFARALSNRPLILLADEPTGNLDPHTTDAVFNVLLSLVRRGGLAALIATHNMNLARRMDRIVALAEGHLLEIEPDENETQIEQIYSGDAAAKSAVRSEATTDLETPAIEDFAEASSDMKPAEAGQQPPWRRLGGVTRSGELPQQAEQEEIEPQAADSAEVLQDSLRMAQRLSDAEPKSEDQSPENGNAVPSSTPNLAADVEIARDAFSSALRAPTGAVAARADSTPQDPDDSVAAAERPAGDRQAESSAKSDERSSPDRMSPGMRQNGIAISEKRRRKRLSFGRIVKELRNRGQSEQLKSDADLGPGQLTESDDLSIPTFIKKTSSDR